MTRRTLPLLTAAVTAATLALPAATPAVATEPARTTTAAGTVSTDDHIDLALTLSGLTGDGPVPMSVDGIVLATADRFPDAMAGAAIADRDDTALLFTGPDRLDGRVHAALDRLMDAKTTGYGHLRYGELTVWLLGGPQALSGTVERQVAGIHDRIRVVRLDGDSREHTALKVADEAIDLYDQERCSGDGYTAPNRPEWWWQHPPEPTCGHAQWRDMTRDDGHGNPVIHDNRYWPQQTPRRIDVTIARGWGHPADVNGASAWADSMTAATYLAADGDDQPAAVVVLAAADGLDRQTRRWLETSPARHATLVGGPDALPGRVADQAAAAGLKVRRIAGADRIATSVSLFTAHTGARPDVHVPGRAWAGQDTLLVNGWADNGWGLALAAVNDGRPVLWALPHGLAPEHDGILIGCGDRLLRSTTVIGDRTLSWDTVSRSLADRWPDACAASPWVADGRERFPSCVTLNVYVNDDGLPSHARQGIGRAIDELNRHSTGTRLTVAGSSHLRPGDAWGDRQRVRDTHGNHAVVIAAARSWSAGSSQATGGSDHHDGRRTVGDVAVRPGLNIGADAFAQLMLHELGHVLGLGHVPQHTGQTMRHRHDDRWEGLHGGDRSGLRWATSGPC